MSFLSFSLSWPKNYLKSFVELSFTALDLEEVVTIFLQNFTALFFLMQNPSCCISHTIYTAATWRDVPGEYIIAHYKAELTAI